MSKFLKKGLMFPLFLVAAVAAGGYYFIVNRIPKCDHDDDKYSFPRNATREQIAVRTCTTCGFERPYDMVEMCFLSNERAEQLTEKRRQEAEATRVALDCVSTSSIRAGLLDRCSGPQQISA